MWCLPLKNKQKIHNYVILNYKCMAKKTSQWTGITGVGDQRVNKHASLLSDFEFKEEK